MKKKKYYVVDGRVFGSIDKAAQYVVNKAFARRDPFEYIDICYLDEEESVGWASVNEYTLELEVNGKRTGKIFRHDERE